METREQRILTLIDKAMSQKENSTIDYDYWENLLFRMTDNGEMTSVEAYAIDKILGLNLY